MEKPFQRESTAPRAFPDSLGSRGGGAPDDPWVCPASESIVWFLLVFFLKAVSWNQVRISRSRSLNSVFSKLLREPDVAGPGVRIGHHHILTEHPWLTRDALSFSPAMMEVRAELGVKLAEPVLMTFAFFNHFYSEISWFCIHNSKKPNRAK